MFEQNLANSETHISPPALEGFRLSPQQARLWLLQERDRRQEGRDASTSSHADPDSNGLNGAGPYQATVTVRIEGPLDNNALRTAINAVLQRHEILRTAFRRLPGMTIPLQVISEQGGGNSNERELVGHSSNGHSAVTLLQNEETSLNAILHPIGTHKHELVLSLPAICTDAVGLENLVSQIASAYVDSFQTALTAENELLDEDDEPMQYVDFAEWQHEILESEDAALGLAYWQQWDLSESVGVQLPFDRTSQRAPIESSQPFQPAPLPLTLDSTLVQGANAAAQRHQTTLPTVLLACWQLTLWRLNGSVQKAIGVSYDGRNYAELEEGIGLYARYLPVVTDLSPSQRFGEVVRELDAICHQAADQQECFSWELAGLVNNEQNSEQNSATWLPFAFEMAPAYGQYHANDVAFIVTKRQAFIERFDVRLHFTGESVDSSGSLVGQIEYDTNRYDEADITRLAEQFVTLLGNACQQPDPSIDGLSLLSAESRHELSTTVNQTETDFGPFQPIHALIEAQAVRRPNAVAAIFENDSLTYGQLNERANTLATYLQAQGVKLESIVAIDMERSLDVLIAMLAILKAGGAYLPLDPKLPAERRHSLLADAQPAVILDEINQLKVHLPFERENPTPDFRIPDSDALAYILYTSGSTGQPKGVGVTHANLVNYVRGAAQRLDLPDGASYATVTTFAADLGNTAIFPALCSGGCLHVISQERASDPNALADYFEQHPIDCMKIVPSHLAALLTSDRAKDLLPQARLVIGGEALTTDLVAKIHALQPSCQIINHYGPTETTVGVTTYTVPESSVGKDAGDTGPIPMGHPLANTQAYVLDRRLEPVPIWSAGELYIGGANVSRGYLNRPDGTAERFIPDPHGSTAGARLYRTGDLVRRLPSGAVEFVGRIDHQIKIRGFRIELGEIESALRQHDSVADAVVIGRAIAGLRVARQETDNETRLIAYVVPHDMAQIDGGHLSRELQSHLQSQLPDYMIPSVIMPLADLPLTDNGKLNRNALPDPAEAFVTSSDDEAVPRTQIEEMIAGIWRDVLGIERVGLHDDFFTLGGHSLMITRVAARLASVFQIDLPVQLLFEQRTVAELAQTINQSLHHRETTLFPALVPVSRSEPLPLSFAQQRLWFYDQLHPDSTAFNIPGSICLKGPFDVPALIQALGTIMERHEILRTTFLKEETQTGEIQAVQHIHSPQPIDLPIADLSHLSASERMSESSRLISDAAQRPFDLAQRPLLRVGLIRLSPDEHIFHFVMHHIISDAWSMELLVNELADLYTATIDNEPPSLPELALQYADFAHWQRAWLQGDALENQLIYWRQQLEGAPTGLTLPTDHARPDEQVHRGQREIIQLSAELSQQLRELSQKEGLTLFMTLLGTFKVLLRNYTHEDDLVIGTNSANRSHAQTAGLMGFFVNQLVLRTDLAGNPTLREVLNRVRTTALGAYAHQDLPFEKLVETLQPDRDMSRSLLFQIKFELQQGVSKELTLPNLIIEPMTDQQTVVRHDLHMLLNQNEAELQATMLYDANLYERETVTRLLDEYGYLLECMVVDPDARLDEVNALLSKYRAERQAETEEALTAASLSKLRGRKRKTVGTEAVVV